MLAHGRAELKGGGENDKWVRGGGRGVCGWVASATVCVLSANLAAVKVTE